MRTWAAAALVLTVTATGCDSGPPDTSPQRSGSSPDAAAALPFGETFSATSFERSGREVAIFGGGPLTVSFSDEDGERSIGWRSGCNDFGGRLESKSEIEVRQPISTLVGCPAPLLEQDRLISQFFESGPDWSLDDGLLVLSAGYITIELEPAEVEQEDPGSPVNDPETTQPGADLDCEFGPGQIVGATYDVNLSSAGEPKAFLALRDFLRDENLGVAAYEFGRSGSSESVSFQLVVDGSFIAEVATIEAKNGWLVSGYQYCRDSV